MSDQTSFRWDGNAVHWRGKASYQLPSDLVRYQEIIVDRKPDWIIETGPGEGGTTQFLRDLGQGNVIAMYNSLEHIEALSRVISGGLIMAILDSDVYNRDHMAAEILTYASLVSVGQFLIVCHTDRDDWGAKPALQDFLQESSQFVIRPSPNPSMSTYLERIP